MADITTLLADRFATSLNEQNQPMTEMVNARIQRIQELERVRLEHSAVHRSSSGDASTRHSRRDRFIRQTSQLRSTERRTFSSNIQRTPVQSQSFEHTGDAEIGGIEDTLDFRQHFENTRQNLFWPREGSSSENLVSGSSYGRRRSDSPVAEPVSFQTGSDSGSGSSSPVVSMRSEIDITSEIADAFSNIRSSIMGSDSSASSRSSRSSSITRETRNSSSTNLQRFAMTNSNGGSITRSASLREPRHASLFRRRTIDGVDRNITRALEQESRQVTSSVSRSISPLVTQSSSISESAISETTSRTQSTHASAFSSVSSAYANRSKTVDLYPEDSVPVLGFDDENVIFVDCDGKCHWLNKHHQLLRVMKETNKLPDIIKRPKLAITKPEDSDGYIATMEGDADARCGKLRELVFLAKRRDVNFKNGDCPDSTTSLSLLELHQRGDLIEKDTIDELYKSVSLYTLPRTKPDLDSYILSKEVLSLYDGIADANLPQEVIDRVKSETEVINDGANSYVQNSSSSSSQSTSTRTESNRATTRTTTSEQSRSEERRKEFFTDTLNRNGNISAAYSRSNIQHEAYSTEIQSDESESLRYSRSNETEQQLESQYTDSVSTISQRRTEARRQQYSSEQQSGESGRTNIERRAEERQQRFLEDRQSSENGSTVIQRRAEERQQQHFAEEHTNENGSKVSQTRSERQQTVSSESRTSRYGQQSAEQRHQHYRSTQTNSTENKSTSVRQVEQSSMVRQSSQTSMATRQSSLSGTFSETNTDNSDLHSEVNLVMERLRNMHENTNIPLDTSHLDLEEMQMIQKALAENPESPPDSPVEFESAEFTTGNIISNSEEESKTNQPTNTITDATAGITDKLIPNPDQLTLDIDHSIRGVTENSSVASDLTENPSVMLNASSVTRSSASSSMQTSSSNSMFISERQTVISHTSSNSSVLSSVTDNVVEARTPRYQRLPSESLEARLALPSIDWSPLERSNSPHSPNRFSFEEQQTENTDSTTSAEHTETVLANNHTVPKVNQSISQTGTTHSVQRELTIEIPPDSPITNLNLTNGNGTIPMNGLSLTNPSDCSKSDTEIVQSAVSPMVDSNRFSSGSEASSAGSETVTTVFEEFVQTIPRSMLSEWSTTESDNN